MGRILPAWPKAVRGRRRATRTPAAGCDPTMKTVTRRQFLRRSSAALAASVAFRARAADPDILGQGDFRYRVVPGWGNLGESTPVNDCHGLAIDREGHVILFTNETRNNVVVYDRRGKLVHKWGTQFPGAHGLSLVVESGREVLYLTDLSRHLVAKTTTDGTLLREWRLPDTGGKYAREDDYRPSWTLHRKDGGFYVLDGYGKDYILEYAPDGSPARVFGGAEGGIVHWGPHGGMIDRLPDGRETLLVAMSDQQYLLRLSGDGTKLGQVDLPGGNPRQIRRHGKHYFVAHLGDNWPKDRECRGFVSVLDEHLRVISNVGGTAPEYDAAGKLRPMAHRGEVFRHPHDLAIDRDGSLYVAQFASGKTYPIKLERVS